MTIHDVIRVALVGGMVYLVYLKFVKQESPLSNFKEQMSSMVLHRRK